MGGTQAKSLQYSTEVEAAASPESTGRRRAVLFPGELVETLPGYDLENAWDLFELGVAKSATKPCLGTRKRDAAGNLGAFEWLTFGEVKEMALKIGFALRKLDLVPLIQYEDEKKFKQLRLLGIFAKNRMEWVVIEQACNAYNVALCPLYDTLGENAIAFILAETQMTTVACGLEGIAALVNAACDAPDCSLKNIIAFGAVTPEMKTNAENAKIRLLEFDELLEVGKDYQRLPKEELAKKTDVSTICYTSGTTGTPKGVVILHSNFVALCCASIRGPLSSPDLELSENDRAISYLPLAHVYERIFTNVLFVIGGSTGFYAGDTQKLVEDIRALQPTIFCSVPRLFYRINSKVLTGLQDKSAFAQFLFTRGINVKMAQAEQTGNPVNAFWDKLVFSKTRALLGGRVRFMVTGSAPLDPTVSLRMRCLFCVPLLDGYGMTESLGASFISDPFDPRPGCMGPLPCLEFRLISVPEMNYFVTDDPPRGELLMRGPSITAGYFRNKEETVKTFDGDGWLHSGDIATLMPDGSIRIFDRRKNIFKLAQGEYLAPEKIESIYAQAPLVSQTFIFGYSSKHFAVAIVVPDAGSAKRWAARNGVQDSTLSGLCRNSAFKEAVAKEMKDIAITGGLKGFEMAKDFHLTPDAFTPENNLVTPTLKLRRHELEKVYNKQIDEMYERLETAA